MAQQQLQALGAFQLRDQQVVNANFTDLYGGAGANGTSTDQLTAHAGGGQAGALPLPSRVNRVTVVATAGDSVVLPASTAATQTIVVVNSGANPLQVFGLGTDTVNDQAAATGVSQVANSIEFYVSPVLGKWYADVGTGYTGSLVTDSSSDALTAHAGGGQANAIQLVSLINRVTVVAAIGDSVMLPASAAGLDIILVNHGANTMQVYGNGTDTIDDVPTANGVSQMAGSVCLYVCTTTGRWYSNGIGTGFFGGLPTQSYTSAITATAGGGQAGAVQLTTVINRVAVVATANDSVKLPGSAPGVSIYVANVGAQSANVFPATGDQINALGVNAAFAVAAGKTADFTCALAGNWHVILSA